MDRIIEKTKKGNLKKFRALIVTVVLTAAGGVWAITTSNPAGGINIDENTIVVGSVRRGEFKVTVRAPGVLLPRNIRWLVAEVDGYVEAVHVKPGQRVTKGQVLLELTNPLLVQQLEELEWELKEVKAAVTASALTLESRILDQEAACLNAENAFKSSKMFFDAESELLAGNKSSISLLNYKKTELQMHQNQSLWNTEIQRLEKLKSIVNAEFNASTARINRKNQSLLTLRQQVVSLTVRATSNAVIQEMPFEPGQRVMIGEPLSKLTQQGDLYAELSIPEVQIRRVSIGQHALIDTRNSKINGQVIRVDPSVRDGVVKVDVKITDPLPDDARPDLSIDGEITVADIATTLYVSRPTFAQSRSTTRVFKLNPDGTEALSTTVSFGEGASDRIEVLAGLLPGDQIIISDTSSWEGDQLVRIKR